MDMIPRNNYGERCQFDAYCKLVLYHEQSTTSGKCRGAVIGNCHSVTFRKWRWTSSAL